MFQRSLSLLLLAGFLSAHEQPTHLNLTAQALNYLQSSEPVRFGLMQKSGAIYSLLADGSWNEDAFFNGFPGYLGRFYFHFFPSLHDLRQSANCTSWIGVC